MDFSKQLDAITRQLTERLPDLLLALAVLVIGWLVAMIVARLVRNLLERARVDHRLGDLMGAEEGEPPPPLAHWLSQAAFLLVMLFVLNQFFIILGFNAVSVPLTNLLNSFSANVNNLIAAVVLLLVAWVVATIVRLLVLRGAEMSRLDERLVQVDGDVGTQTISVAHSLATAATAFVYLAFLPGILGLLGITNLATPVQGLLTSFLATIPHLFSAAVILIVGWFIARIVRQLVVNLLAAAGADRLAERAGAGSIRLSRLVGTIVYAFILIPAVVSALDQLEIAAISKPATEMLTAFMSAVPNIFGAALVLGVAYMAGRLVAGLVTNVLAGLGFNGLPGRLGLHNVPTEGARSPSATAGYVTLVAILLFASSQAANLLQFTSLESAINEVIALGGRVILGLAILAIGLYFANLARNVILNSAGDEGALLAALARWAIVVFSVATALGQMGMAETIINDAWRALVFGLGIALALAFGLGGRDAAARIIERQTAGLPGGGESEFRG